MNYQATKKLTLNAGIIYNRAESDWQWDFSERDNSEFGAGASAYAYSDIENDIDSYSDLSYTQIQYTAGGRYNFSETFYTSAQITFDDFNADEEYVYGDESGDVVRAYIGLGWVF